MKRLILSSIFAGAFCLMNSPAAAQAHFSCNTNTGNNATVVIPASANPNIDGIPLNTGDEIAVVMENNQCAGSVVWEAGKNAALTVWGDDDQTTEKDGLAAGDAMRFRVWRKSADREVDNVSVTYSQGDGTYQTDGTYVVASLNATTTGIEVISDTRVPTTFALFQNFPNPFNPRTTIRLDLPRAAEVQVGIFTITGREVQRLLLGVLAPGMHYLVYDGERLPSGAYVYRVSAGRLMAHRVMTLAK